MQYYKTAYANLNKNSEWSSMLAKCFYPKVVNDWDVIWRLLKKKNIILALRHFQMIYGRLFMWKDFSTMLETESVHLKNIKHKPICITWFFPPQAIRKDFSLQLSLDCTLDIFMWELDYNYLLTWQFRCLHLNQELMKINSIISMKTEPWHCVIIDIASVL